MNEPNYTREFGQVRTAVLLGLFTGTGVGLGYLLAGVPGVELMSVNAALAGAALGLASGVAVGALSVLVYSLASPFGPPLPPMLLAQVIGMALAGLGGGLFGVRARQLPPLGAAFVAAVLGLTAAIVLDLLTNLAVVVALALPWRGVLATGLPIAAVHVVVAAVAWGILLPLLAGRLARIRQPGPQVMRTMLPWLLVAMVLPGTVAGADEPSDPAVAPVDSMAFVPSVGDSVPIAVSSVDSTVVVPVSTMPENWVRPLWQPFHGSLAENLLRTSTWLPVRDGGAGGAVVVFGEPATSTLPTVWRDEVMVGVGHRYLDDYEAVSSAGRTVRSTGARQPGGGLGGGLQLVRRDPVPDRDLVDTRWYKGKHESFLRDVQFLSASAPWRLSFDFQEVLDVEGYDFRTANESRYPLLDLEQLQDFVGRAKFRAGRGSLQRRLDGAGTVDLSVENTRKLKHALPAYDLEHHDLWRNDVALVWRTDDRIDPSLLALWWSDTDNLLEDESGLLRLLEGSRTGARAVWNSPASPVRIETAYRRWSLRDSGAAASWAPDFADTSRHRGEEADLRVSRQWRVRNLLMSAALEGNWAQDGGGQLGGSLAVTEDRPLPRWRVALDRGGRAPRSDELATAWRFVVPGGGQTVVLPDPDLEREKTWRLAATAGTRLVGCDLEFSAAQRRLRHGIGWEVTPTDASIGRWTNGVTMDATTLRAALQREGRFLGWIRLRAEGAWHRWSRDDDLRIALPPGAEYRLATEWEQRFFEEDGILQLGAYLHNRGEMDDPWHLANPVTIASYTRADLIVGFRLVGTNLSLEMCDLLGAGSQVTAGSVAPPTDRRWRLHWVFHY